jgi:hypothetical protein
MRNAVFAVGCRASAAMNGTKDFAEVRQKSLQFFFNALSVFTNLIFMPTGLSAVQALIVMVSPTPFSCACRDLDAHQQFIDFIRRAPGQPGCRVHAMCGGSATRAIQRPSQTAIKNLEPPR